MRRPLLLLLALPFIAAATNGDDDLKTFLGVPEHPENDDRDYESTVTQIEEGMPIAAFPPDKVSAAKEPQEDTNDYMDLLAPVTEGESTGAPTVAPQHDASTTVASSLASVHRLPESDASSATVAARRKSGANQSLKMVTFAPFKPTFRLPVTSTTTARPFGDPRNPEGYGSSRYRPGPVGYQAQYAPAPRTFNYFNHYPFYRLPRAWRLRPDVIYTYPQDLQNTAWQYPHRLPYKDVYSLLRHPNPYGCGPGASYGYASGAGGCGGGGVGGRGGASSLAERPLGTLGEDGKAEWTENDDLNLATKEDPLEDISLETLEKIDKAGKSQDRKDKGEGGRNPKPSSSSPHPTLLEDDDLIDGHQFVPIAKDEEKFSRVGEESRGRVEGKGESGKLDKVAAEESLVGISSKDTEEKEAAEIGKAINEEEKISPQALEELKEFEKEFANLPPRFSSDDKKESN